MIELSGEPEQWGRGAGNGSEWLARPISPASSKNDSLHKFPEDGKAYLGWDYATRTLF